MNKNHHPTQHATGRRGMLRLAQSCFGGMVREDWPGSLFRDALVGRNEPERRLRFLNSAHKHQAPASKSWYQTPNPGTSPQIPGTRPQILLQTPGPGRRSCPNRSPHLPGSDPRQGMRAPFQARSREHAARSKLPPPAAPRPIAPS